MIHHAERWAIQCAHDPAKRESIVPQLVNGFSTYLARYPDDHITVALLANREASPALEPLAKTVALLARENP